MLLCGLLVHRGIGCGDSVWVELCGLPNEVLKQIALILGQQEVLGLGHNLAEILHESLALGGELVGGAGEGLGGQEAVQSDIDLVILARNGQKQSIDRATRSATYRWDLAVLECSGNAVDLELPVDIGLLELQINRFVDVG